MTPSLADCIITTLILHSPSSMHSCKRKYFQTPNFMQKKINILSTELLGYFIIGEQSEPPSDKLGGEIFIASHVLVCLSP